MLRLCVFTSKLWSNNDYFCSLLNTNFQCSFFEHTCIKRLFNINNFMFVFLFYFVFRPFHIYFRRNISFVLKHISNFFIHHKKNHSLPVLTGRGRHGLSFPALNHLWRKTMPVLPESSRRTPRSFGAWNPNGSVVQWWRQPPKSRRDTGNRILEIRK